ncbi:MAG: endonuclease MutS2 [Eubacteriaceae bacterium]|jgi:DNA mismatch repair protein MutS2|nr:endonuclease MutS2 [Eubacteriaceae bacterium]
MDKRSMRVLELHKIQEKLKEFCKTGGGRLKAENMLPMLETYLVQESLESTDEALQMTLRNGTPPIADVFDVKDYLKRAEIGSTLSFKEFLRIASMLKVCEDVQEYFDEDLEIGSLNYLIDYRDNMVDCKDIIKEIQKSILSESEIADDASPELKRIRHEIQFKNRRINDVLERILNSQANEKALQEKIVTLRSNRYVIPVKQEYRSQIKGHVLDRSASGATLFIEPSQVVELNNELRLLEIDEDVEIQRILIVLGSEIALHQEDILENYRSLIELDFIFAKAAYALEIYATKPKLTESKHFYLKKARHPLLDPKTVVASDIYMHTEINTLVITGPNTGGKTVTLKTIGLLILMVKCGMFIPVQEGSTVHLYNRVLADIGDEQSIEQSLSTFSAHLTNIVRILKVADEDSLVLFDELGAGTDPTEGAALGISIIEYLKEQKITTVATTHYSEIKSFALVTPGVTNASVEFDVETLQPTYRLLIGLPGKSNAFEIAQKLGLSSDIIDEARKHIDTKKLQFEEVLVKIENKQRQIDALHLKAQEEHRAAQLEKERLEEENKALRQSSEDMILAAQMEAEELLSETREKTERIYREIRKMQNQARYFSGSNRELEGLRTELHDQERKIRSKKKRKPKPQRVGDKLNLEDVENGMQVFVESIQQRGEILDILPKEKSAMVFAGSMKLKVPIHQLSYVEETSKKEPFKTNKKRHSVDKAPFDPKLDIRGFDSQEGVFRVEKFLSDALLANVEEVIIIHGKGTGVLKTAVHQYLKDNKQIKSFRFGTPSEGSYGATVVAL